METGVNAGLYLNNISIIFILLGKWNHHVHGKVHKVFFSVFLLNFVARDRVWACSVFASKCETLIFYTRCTVGLELRGSSVRFLTVYVNFTCIIRQITNGSWYHSVCWLHWDICKPRTLSVSHTTPGVSFPCRSRPKKTRHSLAWQYLPQRHHRALSSTHSWNQWRGWESQRNERGGLPSFHILAGSRSPCVSCQRHRGWDTAIITNRQKASAWTAWCQGCSDSE